METVVKPPGLSSPCTMKGSEGLLTTFGVGCTPHIERQACTDLSLRADPVALLLPLTLAPVAPLHRMRGRWQPCVIQQRQGLVQRGGQALLQPGPEGGAARDTPAPLRQCVEGGLGPTAPIASRGPLLQDRPQRLELGEPTADAPQGLPCGVVAVTRDAQLA
jgi:hypothetical protein